jgi:hypothetical protein
MCVCAVKASVKRASGLRSERLCVSEERRERAGDSFWKGLKESEWSDTARERGKQTRPGQSARFCTASLPLSPSRHISFISPPSPFSLDMLRGQQARRVSVEIAIPSSGSPVEAAEA